MQLVFATNNNHKIKEVQSLLKGIKLMSLQEAGCFEELSETGNTLEANAMQKAEYFYNKYHMNCFADDTGLEIPALNNRPGVLSARYAGEEKSALKNIEKVMKELDGFNNRIAKFKTVISLIVNNKIYLFKGIVDGVISRNLIGTSGFGYDPLFIPDGYAKTFAEMTLEEKNKISHRGIAIRHLAEFLNTLKAD